MLAAHAGACSLGQDSGYGTFVQITSQDGSVQTLYAHLQDALVTNGQVVNHRISLAMWAAPGNSSSPHLHLGWKVMGVRNPAYGDWIDPYLGRSSTAMPRGQRRSLTRSQIRAGARVCQSYACFRGRSELQQPALGHRRGRCSRSTCRSETNPAQFQHDAEVWHGPAGNQRA